MTNPHFCIKKIFSSSIFPTSFRIDLGSFNFEITFPTLLTFEQGKY